LLRRFNCHINFEVANTAHLFQYIFKYIHKGTTSVVTKKTYRHFHLLSGPDSTKYQIKSSTDRQQAVDEIEEFWKARYLSTGEGMWRILGFHITKKSPSVTALPIHLAQSTRCYQYQRKNDSASKLSLLDRYFLRLTATVQINGNTRSLASLTYQEYYQHLRLTTYNTENNTRSNYFLESMNTAASPRMHVVL
jgi:hypothetical protein